MTNSYITETLAEIAVLFEGEQNNSVNREMLTEFINEMIPVQSYNLHVICDESNNPYSVIDQGNFNVTLLARKLNSCSAIDIII